MALLVRDPAWVYTYWDFSSDTWAWVEAFRKRDNKLRYVVRMHNLDYGNYFDTDVKLESSNWYLHLGLPDNTFEAELGLVDGKGRFHLIARSNRIRTPRNGPSTKIDPHWEAQSFDEVYSLSGGGKPGPGSQSASQFMRLTS